MHELLSKSYEKVVGKGLYPLYETYLRGRSTFKYWAEFEETQWLSPDELKALQWSRLRAVLRHAYDTVGFYRRTWSEMGIHPDDIRTPEDFNRLPTIDKPTIRQHYDEFFSSAYKKSSLVKRATGGSTGAPLQFCYDRNSYQRRLAAWFRGDRWAGWELCGGDFYIWGSAILPQAPLEKWKATLHHAGMRRVIINSFELTRDKIEPLVRRYNRMAPRVVCGYTNAIYEFARQVKQAGLSLRPPTGVITSAEKLYGYQREVIEDAFGAKVFDRYGCREVMMIGAECEQHTGLHVTADNLYVEVLRGGAPCEPGQVGEVVITDLHNYGFPLIRYRIGDAASWRGEPCSCGRGLPLLN